MDNKAKLAKPVFTPDTYIIDVLSSLNDNIEIEMSSYGSVWVAK